MTEKYCCPLCEGEVTEEQLKHVLLEIHKVNNDSTYIPKIYKKK